MVQIYKKQRLETNDLPLKCKLILRHIDCDLCLAISINNCRNTGYQHRKRLHIQAVPPRNNVFQNCNQCKNRSWFLTFQITTKQRKRSEKTRNISQVQSHWRATSFIMPCNLTQNTLPFKSRSTVIWCKTETLLTQITTFFNIISTCILLQVL